MEKQFVFTFRTTEDVKYYILIDQFPNHFYAVKFYPKRLEHLKEKKFNVLYPTSNPSRVIGTVFHCMLSFLRKEQNASFIVGGARKIKDNVEELKENNTRYRIYKKLTYATIGQQTFEFFRADRIGYFLLINRYHSNRDQLIDSMVNEFTKVYAEELSPTDFIADADVIEITPARVG